MAHCCPYVTTYSIHSLVAIPNAANKVIVSNSTVVFVSNEVSWQDPDHFFRLRIAGYVCGGLFVIVQAIISIGVPIVFSMYVTL